MGSELHANLYVCMCVWLQRWEPWTACLPLWHQTNWPIPDESTSLQFISIYPSLCFCCLGPHRPTCHLTVCPFTPWRWICPRTKNLIIIKSLRLISPQYKYQLFLLLCKYIFISTEGQWVSADWRWILVLGTSVQKPTLYYHLNILSSDLRELNEINKQMALDSLGNLNVFLSISHMYHLL